jgi:cytochrome c oxidase cbb3-type subunit 1
MQPQADYDKTIVRCFAIMAAVYVGMGLLLFIICAIQLRSPEITRIFEPWNYGRLRPLYTNALFLGCGGALFATSLHVVQRTGHTGLFAPQLAWLLLFGWNLLAVIEVAFFRRLLMGVNATEFHMYDFWSATVITVVWSLYAVVFFGTLAIRKVRRFSVLNWIFGTLIIATLLLLMSFFLGFEFRIT